MANLNSQTSLGFESKGGKTARNFGVPQHAAKAPGSESAQDPSAVGGGGHGEDSELKGFSKVSPMGPQWAPIPRKGGAFDGIKGFPAPV